MSIKPMLRQSIPNPDLLPDPSTDLGAVVREGFISSFVTYIRKELDSQRELLTVLSEHLCPVTLQRSSPLEEEPVVLPAEHELGDAFALVSQAVRTHNIIIADILTRLVV